MHSGVRAAVAQLLAQYYLNSDSPVLLSLGLCRSMLIKSAWSQFGSGTHRVNWGKAVPGKLSKHWPAYSPSMQAHSGLSCGVDCTQQLATSSEHQVHHADRARGLILGAFIRAALISDFFLITPPFLASSYIPLVYSAGLCMFSLKDHACVHVCACVCACFRACV